MKNARKKAQDFAHGKSTRAAHNKTQHTQKSIRSKDKGEINLKPKGYKTNTASLLLGTFVISILSLALPVMTLQVYDRILPNPGTGTLPVLIAGVCVAVLLEMILRLCRAYVIGRSGAAYEHRIACDAMKKVLGADLSQMAHHGIGEHMQRMSAASKLKDFYNGYSVTVWAELAFVPLFFILIYYISSALVIVPLVILACFTVFSLWQGRKLRAALSEREKTDDSRFNFLIESLEGVHTLKSFALEKNFQRRYENLEDDSTKANFQVTQITADTFNTASIFSHIMVAAVITAGAVLALNGDLSTGGLIAVLLLSGRIMQPVQKALSLWTRYQDYDLAREHIRDLLATPQQRIRKNRAATKFLSSGELALRDLSFRHVHCDHDLLSGINLSLKHGDCITIGGAHGAGKTTLFKLIAGIYPPNAGRILVEDKTIDMFTPEDLIHHIGYIRARGIIFRGTIRDNITCFGQIDERKAREMSTILGVDKDVAKLPGGFDTFLTGNASDSITPGLKQRIAITRVLSTRPKIILFDNADSALDKEGYTMIYSLLARLKHKATLVLISDDRNICALADRQYILEDGQLSLDQSIPKQTNIHPYRELRI